MLKKKKGDGSIFFACTKVTGLYGMELKYGSAVIASAAKQSQIGLLRISTKYVGNLHISLTHNTPRISILEEMKEISRINGRE